MVERQTKWEEALQLAKDVRQDLFEEKKAVSTILLQCKTICRYLGISEENRWIEQELDGYFNDYKTYSEFKDAVPSYRVINLLYFDLRNNPIRLPYNIMETFGRQGFQESITELESSTEGLTITGSPLIDGLNSFIAKYVTNAPSFPPVFKAILPDNQVKKIIMGVRNRIGEFLDKTILELEYGGIPEHIFEDIRKEVDHKLVSTCPNAIEKLKVTYERISSSQNPEDWTHVASSCRRILKDVADAIFPAQPRPSLGTNGKEHRLDESAYINRIVTGIKIQATSKSEISFLTSIINYVDKFLHEIQGYASKGDHATFTKTDAVRCVVYTYLLLGDILHYYYSSNEIK